MRAKKPRYVFGPVPSRRLGRSLGIDLIPFKTCAYDCVYCQLGRTTCRTAERREYAPVDEVLRQLDEALASGPPPDVITLAGSGEPTLHSRLGEILAGIKTRSNLPLVVLTNGSLLHLPEVRDALQSADAVTPDLDAGSEDAWRTVCRPADGLDFPRVVEGLMNFAREYRGRLEVEVFLVDGLYDLEAEVDRIAKILSGLPLVVRLNTATRPGAEPEVSQVAGRDALGVHDDDARAAGPGALERLPLDGVGHGRVAAHHQRAARALDVLAAVDVQTGDPLGDRPAAAAEVLVDHPVRRADGAQEQRHRQAPGEEGAGDGADDGERAPAAAHLGQAVGHQVERVVPREPLPAPLAAGARAAQRVEQAPVGFPPARRAERSEERRVGKECRSRWSPYH